MILTPPHRNLIAQAHNGSGKTTCFTLGILSRVNVNEPDARVDDLSDERRWVIQNVGVMQRMGKYTNISITVHGGSRNTTGITKNRLTGRW